MRIRLIQTLHINRAWRWTSSLQTSICTRSTAKEKWHYINELHIGNKMCLFIYHTPVISIFHPPAWRQPLSLRLTPTRTDSTSNPLQPDTVCQLQFRFNWNIYIYIYIYSSISFLLGSVPAQAARSIFQRAFNENGTKGRCAVSN